MLANAPYYIILGEFLLALPLVWMVGWLEKLGAVKLPRRSRFLPEIAIFRP